MKASVGDRLVLASSTVDGVVRDGTVVAVRHADGSPPYRVRWHDTGEESLVFPGPDAHVEVGAAVGAAPEGPAGGSSPRSARVETWRVQLTVSHEGPQTTAQAVLVAGWPDHLDAVGRSRRNPADAEVEVIGDEVAVARALHRLADRLLDCAEEDITERLGHSAHVHA
jgi:hypothetical protein